MLKQEYQLIMHKGEMQMSLKREDCRVQNINK